MFDLFGLLVLDMVDGCSLKLLFEGGAMEEVLVYIETMLGGY